MSSEEPDWDRLFETASEQGGMFTARQALEAGYSKQLVAHHVRADRFSRVRRGIYRLVYFPPTEHEDLVVAWLWSERAGVVSHETALALHGLSDVLPARIHLTLPAAWRRRRFRVPAGVVLHHADVPSAERTWFGAVPTTSVRRTLRDCAVDGLAPDLLRQATQQALGRGLVGRDELHDVESALAAFGGVGV